MWSSPYCSRFPIEKNRFKGIALIFCLDNNWSFPFCFIFYFFVSVQLFSNFESKRPMIKVCDPQTLFSHYLWNGWLACLSFVELMTNEKTSNAREDKFPPTHQSKQKNKETFQFPHYFFSKELIFLFICLHLYKESFFFLFFLKKNNSFIFYLNYLILIFRFLFDFFDFRCHWFFFFLSNIRLGFLFDPFFSSFFFLGSDSFIALILKLFYY